MSKQIIFVLLLSISLFGSQDVRLTPVTNGERHRFDAVEGNDRLISDERSFSVSVPGLSDRIELICFRRNGRLRVDDMSDGDVYNLAVSQIAGELSSRGIKNDHPSLYSLIRDMMGWSIYFMTESDYSIKEEFVSIIVRDITKELPYSRASLDELIKRCQPRKV